MSFKTVSMSALLGSKQPTLSSKKMSTEKCWTGKALRVYNSSHNFQISYISEEGTVGWRATKHEKIQTSTQQELLSPCNLQLITSFVFIQRTVWDLFAQIHEHSNAELAHSLMLEEILYSFDISPSPTTERFATAEGFYSQGEHLFYFFSFFSHFISY